jgi:hypothetical protein
MSASTVGGHLDGLCNNNRWVNYETSIVQPQRETYRFATWLLRVSRNAEARVRLLKKYIDTYVIIHHTSVDYPTDICSKS